MQKETMELAFIVLAYLLATGPFLYGVISMRGGVKEFKEAVQDLSRKLDRWIEHFTADTTELKAAVKAIEARCAERGKDCRQEEKEK